MTADQTTTPPPANDKLAACPFCGEPGLIVAQPYDEYDVICSVPGCHITGPPRNSLVDAVKAWNHRVPDPAHGARIRADVVTEVEAIMKSEIITWTTRDMRVLTAIRALARPTEPRPGAGDAGEW